jgi:hypothetical protein
MLCIIINWRFLPEFDPLVMDVRQKCCKTAIGSAFDKIVISKVPCCGLCINEANGDVPFLFLLVAIVASLSSICAPQILQNHLVACSELL